MSERLSGKIIPALRADGEQVLVSVEIAKNKEFLKKYGMRILDETLIHASVQPFESLPESPKRRPMLRQIAEEVVAPISSTEMMEQTPEVPEEELPEVTEAELTEVAEQAVEEEPLPQEIPTEETPTTKTRRK